MNQDEFEAMLKANPDSHVSTIGGPRAHRVVVRSAKEFAAELYEVYASRWPGFYTRWPSQNDFVRQHWPYFIEEARATLARLLAGDLPDRLKAEIYDGLIKDHSLAGTRAHVPQVRMDI